MATVATGLLIMTAITSLRAVRGQMKWETWRFLHLYAYLAVALAFGHELAVGTDFSSDFVAIWYWVGLYVALVLCILAFRLGNPLWLSFRHDLSIAEIVPEAPGVVSIYVKGRDLEQLRAQAGQYFRWRFFTRDGWWRTHPFSLSAPVNGRYLRITVKGLGDDSRALHGLHPGTAVGLEGPYGLFTANRQRRARVLLIAGGIGITPLRALIEELRVKRDSLALIYRARSWEDLVFKEELEKLIRDRRGTIHYIVGQRGTADLCRCIEDGELDLMLVGIEVEKELVGLVDHIGDAPVGSINLVDDDFICGPASMMERLDGILRSIGVPPEQIHFERFALI